MLAYCYYDALAVVSWASYNCIVLLYLSPFAWSIVNNLHVVRACSLCFARILSRTRIDQRSVTCSEAAVLPPGQQRCNKRWDENLKKNFKNVTWIKNVKTFITSMLVSVTHWRIIQRHTKRAQKQSKNTKTQKELSAKHSYTDTCLETGSWTD